VSSPAIVFADEPTGSLDTATGKVVMGMLQETASRGACVVMVTHDLELAAMAHRVMILVDGRTHGHLQSPTPKQLLAQFESLKANA
jgi:putative ABC transport system ATP-binding protein